MERHGVAFAFHVHAGRVRRTRDMQRPDVQDHHRSDHEGQQEVQREEAVERGVVRGETAQQPDLQRFADHRDRAEQAGDHFRAPEAHLAPGQHVAHEGCGHHQQKDHHAQQPYHFARCLVGTVVEAAEDVEIDHHEECAGAVGMRIAQHPAPVHIAHDVFGGIEGNQRIGRIVHRQDHPGDDLESETEARQNAEIPEIVEIARHGIAAAHRIVDQPGKRQLLIHPFHQRMGRRVFVCPGKAHDRPLPPQPIFTTVSEVN